jgi:hypothetical protein
MNVDLRRWKAPWLLLLTVTACADLDVLNLNDPDVGRSLGTPSEVLSLIGGSFHSWFQGNYDYHSAGLALSNTAFQHNAPWSNSGMEQYGRLPRVGFANTIADSDYAYLTRPYFQSYRAIAAVADGLRALETPEVRDPSWTSEEHREWPRPSAGSCWAWPTRTPWRFSSRKGSWWTRPRTFPGALRSPCRTGKLMGSRPGVLRGRCHPLGKRHLDPPGRLAAGGSIGGRAGPKAAQLHEGPLRRGNGADVGGAQGCELECHHRGRRTPGSTE